MARLMTSTSSESAVESFFSRLKKPGNLAREAAGSLARWLALVSRGTELESAVIRRNRTGGIGEADQGQRVLVDEKDFTRRDGRTGNPPGVAW